MKHSKTNRSDYASPGSLTFRILHVVFDLCALALAWRMALELRLWLNPYMTATMSRAQLGQLAPPLSGLIILWIISAVWRRTYGQPTDTSAVAGLLKVAESAVIISASAIVLTFFSRRLGTDLSRSFVFLFAPLSFVSLVASFLISIAAAGQVERRWAGKKRVAVLGTGVDAHDVVEAIFNRPDHGISFRGLILPECSLAGGMSLACAGISGSAPLPVLGTTKELAEVINRECLDRIIVATNALTEREVERCGRVSRQMGITVSRPIRPPASDVLVKHQVEYGLHFINLEAAPFTRWEEAIKRGVDMLLAAALICALLPLLALVASLIRLTSNGPVFYRSRRVGKGGRHFTFWKFRTMYVNAARRRDLAGRNECSGHLFKLRSDPRVTPVGRVLRRLSLDELPQLFNVLTGDMSLVGPRPLPIEDLEPDGMSRTFAKWAVERSRVRPGITGLWQVRGRSDLPFSSMVELDMEYIRSWSILLDLSILCETPRAVVSARGAY